MKKLLIILILASTTATKIKATNVTNTISITEQQIAVNQINYSQEQAFNGGVIPASWQLCMQIDLKRGSDYQLGPETWQLDRMRLYRLYSLTDDEMQSVLGDNYDIILDAVQNGEFAPDGEIKAALVAYVLNCIVGTE